MKETKNEIVHARIETEYKEQLEAIAQKDDRSVAYLIRKMIINFLNKR